MVTIASACPRPDLASREAGRSAPTLDDYRALRERRGVEVNQESGVPLISVITVTLNAAKTVERTIASVHDQTYPSVEHIIIDGGSTDGTLERVRSRLRRDDFWISEPDQGISDAFNKGIALARGEYVQIINADDWLSADQLSCAVEALSKTGADFVFGDCICYEEGERAFRYRGDPHYARSLDKRLPPMNHPSMLVRHSAYQRFGLYSLRLRMAMDYEWILRAHRRGGRAAYDERIVAHMGLGGLSLRHFKKTQREVRDISVMYGRDRFPATLECQYHIAKTTLSKPIKMFSKPLYYTLRSMINPAYQRLR